MRVEHALVGVPLHVLGLGTVDRAIGQRSHTDFVARVDGGTDRRVRDLPAERVHEALPAARWPIPVVAPHPVVMLGDRDVPAHETAHRSGAGRGVAELGQGGVAG